MSKEIKKYDNFINENYYETSSTVVPGAGVGAGLFHNVGGAKVKQGLYEKDVPQIGANGIANDPDYVSPSQNTHATWMGQIALADMVEDVNPQCKFNGSMGKVIGILGSGDKAEVQYLIANEGDGWGIGEVAKIAATSLQLIQKHQMNA